MNRLNSILKAACLLACAFVLVELGLWIRDLRRDTENLGVSIQQTVDDLDATVLITRGAVLNASMVLGRIEEASQSWKTVAGKEAAYWEGLQAKTAILLDKTTAIAESANAMIVNTDANLNRDILPAMSGVIRQTDSAVATIDKSLSEASERANADLEAIYRLLSDPAYTAALANIQGVTENVEEMTAQFAEASRSMPQIAADLEKISETSGKYAKPLLIARIASMLAWIIPWLF